MIKKLNIIDLNDKTEQLLLPSMEQLGPFYVAGVITIVIGIDFVH